MRPITEATHALLKPVEEPGAVMKVDTTDYKTFTVTLLPEREGGYIRPRAEAFIDRFPEHKLLVGRSWEVPATDVNCAIILQAWPRELLQVTDDAATVLKFMEATFAKDDLIAQAYADFKERGVVPAHDIVEHPDPELRLSPYQRCGYALAYNNPGFAEFMEQGTGKTPIVVNRICTEAERRGLDRMYRALIVCPNNVRANWAAEFEKFGTVPGKVAVLRGGQMKRLRTFLESFIPDEDSKFTAIICGYEALQSAKDLIMKVQWDLSVLDESHYGKSVYTRRWENIRELRDCSDQRMCLTGSPITNTVHDLYTQLEFLGEGRSGFSSIYGFRGFYSKDGADEGIYVPDNLPFLQERMVRLSFSITKKEALPWLPERTYRIEEVEMSKDQKEAYDKLATQMALEIEAELESGRNKSLIIQNVLTKLLRLAQVTSGFISWDPIFDDDGNELMPKTLEHWDPNPKLEALVSILKQRPRDEKTIVWSCFVPDILAIKERLKQEGIGVVSYYGGDSERARDDAARAFNHDRDVQVIVANPAAGATGNNWIGYPPGQEEDYDTDCTMALYFAKNWSYAQRVQSGDRNHRRGTRRPVENVDLIIPGTIDEVIHARVNAKKDVALQIADIRNILKKLVD